MFESLLNTILEKTLGQYIEGLKKADLEVSVWSGDVELNNVQIKKDIFQQFGLPLELIYGRIGRLKISVPWKNIGSKPVDVYVENVIIVVRPITDQSKWKSQQTNDAEEFNKKRDLVNKFAHKLYSDFMKTKEELAKDAGILDAMVTKIIDNLQVALRNIHVRIENQDKNDEDATFSIGVTLESADLFTTDIQLKKTYIDRSQSQNADLPIYKLLNFKNFGIYYKIKETFFVQHQDKDEDRHKAMQKIGERFDQSGKYPGYADAYLLDPIQLEVVLTQYEPQQAFEKHESLITLQIKLKNVGICLKKSQYDNLQQLLALTMTFMRFLNTAGLQQTKIYWHQLIEELTKKEKVDHDLVGKKDVVVIVKKNVKDLFQQIFQSQIEILASVGIDDDKAKQLLKELNKDLERQNLSLTYERILLAMDINEIEIWTKELCFKKAEEKLQERAIYARQNSSKGFLSNLFNSTKKPEERETVCVSTLPTIPNKAQLIQKQHRSSLAEALRVRLDQMTTQERIKNAIPKIKVNFNLEMFHVQLQDEKGYGVQWYSHGFQVEFKMYDSSNKYNPKAMEVHVINQEFGIKSIRAGEDNPFVQQLSKDNSQPACSVILKIGNQTHHDSDLAQECIDDTDLDLTVKILPIEIIYQASVISRLQKFFRVKKLDERSKLQAAEQFNQLQSQVNSISKSMENDFKNNRINIEVAVPTLVIPLKQETAEQIASSECWVFTMGDICFKDTTRANFDNGYYECFELKVQRVTFEFAHSYSGWKGHQLETVKLLSNICATTLMVRKRNMDEMKTIENKKYLKQIRSSPGFEIIAGFDTELKLSLKPQIFQKLTNIGTLFVVEEHPEEYWLKKKQKRLKDSSFRSEVKRQNNLFHWDQGMACIIFPRWLIFFQNNNYTIHHYFDLNGCNDQDGCVLEGQEVTLKNKKNQICKLQFNSIQLASKWCRKLITAARELDSLKKNVDRLPNNNFENQTVDVDSDQEHRTSIDSFKQANGGALDSSDDSTNEECVSNPGVEFALKFMAPSLQLNLITETINRSANVRSQNQAVIWELGTRVEQLTVNFDQYKYHKEIQAKVSSLRVTDNSGDSRFPVIFENQAVEHQNELLTVKLSKIQKESPHYFDCDTEVSIGIGGLKIFWKPSSLMLLFRFLKKPTQKKENQGEAIDKVKVQRLPDDYFNIEVTDTLKGPRDNLENLIKPDVDLKKQAALATKEPETKEKIKNCLQKPEAQVKVDLQLAFLQLICIHPQNTSYPIFNVDLENLCLEYTKKCDCDQIKLTVANLQIIDTTNYPQTLDPQRHYQASEPLIEREILGVNCVDSKRPEMLHVLVTVFTYSETGSCPLQTSKDFNLNVGVNLKQLKAIIMFEQLLRMIDYINHQIVLVIAPDNVDEEKVQAQHLRESLVKSKINHLFWSKFDLKQQSQGPSLDIKIESPLVIIPDLRSQGLQQFHLDFGKITCDSKIELEKGFWLFLPEKQVLTTTYMVNTSNIRFEFNQSGQNQQIFNNKSLQVNVKLLSYSPFFDEDEPVFTQIPQAPVFDLGQINNSVGVDINLRMMKVNLPQNIINEIFELLNNNILISDGHKIHFEEQLCSKADKTPQKQKKQVSKQDRKVLRLQVTASVLSLDLRDEHDKLISEICVIGLNLGMETYLSGNQSIQFAAGSIFIFFDEQGDQKEMLMGHINTPQLVITDKAFYQDLPVTLLKASKPKFKFTLENSSNGDLFITLEILQLKVWLRPQVFILLSRYLKQALGRLSTLEQKPQISEVNTSEIKIQIHLDESLIIVQHDLVSEQCIVIQTSIDLLFKFKDPESIFLQQEKIDNVTFTTITTDVQNIAGYMCSLKELNEVSFKEASKRDFLQPCSCKIDILSTIDTDRHFGLYTEDLISVIMRQADLKISIEDLQVLQSIVEVVVGEILALQAVWADDKSEILEITEKNQDKRPNFSTMAVHLDKASILIINESKDFYVPLFMLRCEKIGYQSTPMNFKQDQSKGKVNVMVNLNYYNSDVGFFEPAIDRFGVDVEIESVGKSKKIKLHLADPINMNFTIGLIDCMLQFRNVYEVAQDRALSYKQKVKDFKEDMLSSKAVEHCTIHKSKSLKQPGAIGLERVLSVKQEREKFSSLYAVRNLTEKSIKIVQVDRAGQQIAQDSQIVRPDEFAKLVITQGTINQDGSQSDQFISIKFRGEMEPLRRINLNQTNYFTKHSAYGKLDFSREFLVVTSKMEGNRKVLTVRTQHVLTNQTKIAYHIKIFSIDKKTDKIIDISNKMLEPGQSTPLQDFDTVEQHASVRIAIRPKKHKKWGTEYKFLPLKKNMNVEENTEWPHAPSYTIVRKVKNPLDGVFDLVLLPPMIIKNCLPCRMNLQIEEEFKNNTQANHAEGVKPNSQIIELEKQEEKHIYDIINKTFTKNLLLRLDLGSQFDTTILKMNLLQSKDSTFAVKITDTKNRSFNLACKVETKQAGLKLIFYCENMLICRTEQKLSFFYQKKPGVFDKENSHELPSPIVGSQDLVYIFDDNQSMFCSLEENRTSGFSEKLLIKTAGHVGDFQVTPNDSMKQYNFGYSVHMWLSEKNSEIPMTKIVEIAPQFIILNRTDQTLLYQQDHEEDSNCKKLAPGSRVCYNWEDRSKPQLFAFKPENNRVMHALITKSIWVVSGSKTLDADQTMCQPFSLKSLGTIYTCCVSQGQEKTYFKVSKRQVDQSIFAVIEKSEPPYLVVNNLKEIDLRICQNDVQRIDLYDTVKSQCQSPFAWQDVNAANKLLEVEFRFQNKPVIPVNDSKIKRRGQEIRSKKISIDGINQTAKIELIHPVTKATKISVIVSVYRGARSKVIEFSYQPSSMIIEADDKINSNTIEESKEEIDEELDDFENALRQQQKIRPKLEGKDKTTINVDINQLSVSLIMNSNEYMNIVLKTLRFQKINADSDVIYYCTLNRLQIDNSYQQNPIFPVLIRPKCVSGDLEHNHTTMQNVNQVFEFYAHQKLNVPNITFFSTIEFLLRELEIKIEFDYAMKLISYIKVVQDKMAVNFYHQHQIFMPLQKQEESKDHYDQNRALKKQEDQLLRSSNWKEKTIQAVDELVTYVQRFVGSSMCFEITLFKQTGTQEQTQEKEKGSFGLNMAASGLKLTNLNGAPIQLQALEINDVYGHNNDIQIQLQAHYLSNMKYNLLRIAGSSDLIGNPYNFMNNLGSGMKKYYRDPREQIMQGPQAAVMAGVRLFTSGAGMAAHSAASVTGYLGRITGSVNRGIVAASFDRDYIHKKEIRDIQQRPTSTLDGILKGGYGLGSSVLSGVTGLVTKPYEGARQGGMGFVKGVGMGVAGLFSKPVSGIVDLVSKTTQGIESGVTGNAECKQNNVRVRKPRAFYLALSIVKEYNEVDSDAYNHLRQNLSRKDSFWACYICGDGVIQGQVVIEPTNEIMMLTGDYLYSLSNEMKVIWQCPVSEIQDISLDQNQGLIIKGKQDKKGNRFQFPREGTQLVECMTIIDDIKYAASVEELVWTLL